MYHNQKIIIKAKAFYLQKKHKSIRQQKACIEDCLNLQQNFDLVNLEVLEMNVSDKTQLPLKKLRA